MDSNNILLKAFKHISGFDQLTHAHQNTAKLLQNEAFFQLAVVKQQRLNALRSFFSNYSIKKIWFSHTLKLLKNNYYEIPAEPLEKNFFINLKQDTLQETCALLRQSIVIVNNNDVHVHGELTGLQDLLQYCDQTIFIAWDWDNHHWLTLSYPVATFTDLYCPAHYENLYPLTRFNPATLIIPCGIVQWTTDFLAAHTREIITSERQDEPLGKHIFYSGFEYRNRIITTLNQKYSMIGFSTHQFHDLTPEQKLTEWIRYKLHFIVPVLNDIPIRVFDAWATGGIPLIPESLRFSPIFADINAQDLLFYNALDIIEPTELFNQALHLFTHGGEAAILRRHRYGLLRHHGYERIQRMLKGAQQLIGFNLNA